MSDAVPAQPAVPNPDLVNITIDGKQVSVKKGLNVIEAARIAGIEIPHYCYHKHLSVAGNCRMCQVRVKGMPKMEIGCNLQVKEGMEIQTHCSSPEVADTQAAVLEFILANHPLDCTVCDQAGHCKLQDYHYEYNARPSRFLEDKEHKVKAQPLGPTVMLDGERCIMCTRCIRFCDEVTGTSELGMLNRGDHSVIAIHPGKELNNPLSGTVVDLCPVGALTHREWRFNSRIWFTTQTDSICPGCSTGCNVKVAERDGEVVNVKARLNSAVNKEWLCDEGRYGFGRFLPKARITSASVAGVAKPIKDALQETVKFKGKKTLVLVGADCTLEDYSALSVFKDKALLAGSQLVLAYEGRKLTDVEKVLVSPDYAPNFRGAEFCSIWECSESELEKRYLDALVQIERGEFEAILLIGDSAIGSTKITEGLIAAIRKLAVSCAILIDAQNPLKDVVKTLLPGRSILEKAGLVVNRNKRLQFIDRVVPLRDGTEPVWKLIAHLADYVGGVKLTRATSDRERTLEYLASDPRISGLTIGAIKAGGVDLTELWEKRA